MISNTGDQAGGSETAPEGGPVIRVVVEDLAQVVADGLVRPCGEALEPVAGAAERLDRHAGDALAEQRRLGGTLQAGAAVVTGSGGLVAPFVLHVVIRDERSGVGREVVRRALVSAWQRAGDWGLRTLASPLVGAGAGQLSVEESATLLAETFAQGRRDDGPAELTIVVDREADRAVVEAVVRRRA